MSWWWENWIDPYDLYYHLSPLAAFVDGEDFAIDDLHAVTLADLNGPPGMQIYGSSGSRSAYIWLLYWAGNVTDASFRVTGLDPADYTLEYWDTFSNQATSSETIAVGSQGAVLDVPPFNRNIAIKLKAQLPSLYVSPASITTQVMNGDHPGHSQITIENLAFDSANYTISSSETWISPVPSFGSVGDEVDTIDLVYDTDGLVPGIYVAEINVASLEAPGEGLVVEIALTIEAIPIDPDFDGDCDQDDYGRFQACMADGPGPSPDCELFDLNDDDFVNLLDGMIFQSCMTGANVPLDVSCLE
jgi:hypothetical protein